MTRPDQHDGEELDDTVLDDTVLVVRRAATSTVPDDDTVVRPRASTHDERRSAPPVPPAPPPAPPAQAVRRVHALRVGGEAHRLEGPVVVGRRPAAPRVPTGAPIVLVVVPSPTGEVSGSHVRVEQVGATVVVTDLRSTNGTVVTMPGRLPVTLRQGESSVVLAGTIVDVGDGNLLEILPPPRPSAHEGPRP
ncbi:FHA domain-containing protein [Frigoribacterium sp. CFBP 13729]|uniref:FHA domain-containing protein n=1 Tax=Frigoribacterium sp. CFBP 13729 TaxID=2775293 RepID=UPI00177BA9F2|nr:FHA domain-containing protein [Frigoribacterium sp. CFBP 13729]MBD8609463.1 FHA domain-containing protein [Frigoribacterium sp. CFBP 13729]